jgi:hypothetical protein
MVHAPQSFINCLAAEYSVLSSPHTVLLVMFTSYYFVFSILQTLWRFGTTFCRPNPLFSSPYRLFCEKMGGGVYPKPAAVQLSRTRGRTSTGA